MRKLALLFFLFSYCFGQTQDWNVMDIGAQERLNKVYFIDDNNGFITGNNGMLYRTSDGGENWVSIPTGVSHDLLTVSFANSNIGYINGLKTTDGGENWSIQSVTNDFGLIEALDEQNLIGGDGLSFHGEVYKSADGEVTWLTIDDPIETGFYTDAYFIDDAVGYMTAWYSGFLVKTIDAGENWTSISPVIADVSNGMYGVSFPSPTIGIVVSNEHIAKTIDSGQTWSSIYSIVGNNLLFRPAGIFTISESNYIVVGGAYDNNAIETIYETTDGGLTWTLSNNSAYRLEDVTCTSNNCYAVGANGTVLTKSNNIVSTTPVLQDLAAMSVYPNPAINYLRVEANNISIEEVEVVDLYGRVYKKQSLSHNSIFVGNLPSGFYLLKAKFAGIEKVVKFEKM